MKQPIVGITGYKQSGKDEVAKVFMNHGFKRYSFAQPIKDMCRIMFLWGVDHVDGSHKEIIDPRWGISPRQAMQACGTEYGQFLLGELFSEFSKTTGRKVWVNRFRYWYEAAGGDFPVVISDVRFHHEVDVIREMSGIIIRVNRFSESPDPHVSEQEMKQILPDMIIRNSGTLDDLVANAEAAYQNIELNFEL